jgi:hypothetical protein
MNTSGPGQPADAPGIALPITLRSGGKRGRLIGRLQTAGILLLLLALASIPLQVGVSTWATHQSLKKEWTVEGPPCPVVAQISRAALGFKPPPPFVYQRVGFAYQIGDVSCEAVPEGFFSGATHPVCQFDAPAAIKVTTAGRTVIFEPGVGHRATVTVRDGKASCVIGGWFSAYGPLS